ncbi:hypothetical protein DIPPA_00801 [Diplonema papillatum]|nr:hypothetical protein DIPPA_00801 [Diplonema papillatum]
MGYRTAAAAVLGFVAVGLAAGDEACGEGWAGPGCAIECSLDCVNGAENCGAASSSGACECLQGWGGAMCTSVGTPGAVSAWNANLTAACWCLDPPAASCASGACSVEFTENPANADDAGTIRRLDFEIDPIFAKTPTPDEAAQLFNTTLPGVLSPFAGACWCTGEPGGGCTEAWETTCADVLSALQPRLAVGSVSDGRSIVSYSFYDSWQAEAADSPPEALPVVHGESVAVWTHRLFDDILRTFSPGEGVATFAFPNSTATHRIASATPSCAGGCDLDTTPGEAPEDAAPPAAYYHALAVTVGWANASEPADVPAAIAAGLAGVLNTSLCWCAPEAFSPCNASTRCGYVVQPADFNASAWEPEPGGENGGDLVFLVTVLSESVDALESDAAVHSVVATLSASFDRLPGVWADAMPWVVSVAPICSEADACGHAPVEPPAAAPVDSPSQEPAAESPPAEPEPPQESADLVRNAVLVLNLSSEEAFTGALQQSLAAYLAGAAPCWCKGEGSRGASGFENKSCDAGSSDCQLDAGGVVIVTHTLVAGKVEAMLALDFLTEGDADRVFSDWAYAFEAGWLAWPGAEILAVLLCKKDCERVPSPPVEPPAEVVADYVVSLRVALKWVRPVELDLIAFTAAMERTVSDCWCQPAANVSNCTAIGACKTVTRVQFVVVPAEGETWTVADMESWTIFFPDGIAVAVTVTFTPASPALASLVLSDLFVRYRDGLFDSAYAPHIKDIVPVCVEACPPFAESPAEPPAELPPTDYVLVTFAWSPAAFDSDAQAALKVQVAGGLSDCWCGCTQGATCNTSPDGIALLKPEGQAWEPMRRLWRLMADSDTIDAGISFADVSSLPADAVRAGLAEILAIVTSLPSVVRAVAVCSTSDCPTIAPTPEPTPPPPPYYYTSMSVFLNAGASSATLRSDLAELFLSAECWCDDSKSTDCPSCSVGSSDFVINEGSSNAVLTLDTDRFSPEFVHKALGLILGWWHTGLLDMTVQTMVPECVGTCLVPDTTVPVPKTLPPVTLPPPTARPPPEPTEFPERAINMDHLDTQMWLWWVLLAGCCCAAAVAGTGCVYDANRPTSVDMAMDIEDEPKQASNVQTFEAHREAALRMAAEEESCNGTYPQSARAELVPVLKQRGLDQLPAAARNISVTHDFSDAGKPPSESFVIDNFATNAGGDMETDSATHDQPKESGSGRRDESDSDGGRRHSKARKEKKDKRDKKEKRGSRAVSINGEEAEAAAEMSGSRRHSRRRSSSRKKSLRSDGERKEKKEKKSKRRSEATDASPPAQSDGEGDEALQQSRASDPGPTAAEDKEAAAQLEALENYKAEWDEDDDDDEPQRRPEDGEEAGATKKTRSLDNSGSTGDRHAKHKHRKEKREKKEKRRHDGELSKDEAEDLGEDEEAKKAKKKKKKRRSEHQIDGEDTDRHKEKREKKRKKEKKEKKADADEDQ